MSESLLASSKVEMFGIKMKICFEMKNDSLGCGVGSVLTSGDSLVKDGTSARCFSSSSGEEVIVAFLYRYLRRKVEEIS